MQSLRPIIQKVIWTAVIIGSLAALLYAIFFVYDHNSRGQHYLDTLRPAAESLHTDTVILASKTERYLMTDLFSDRSATQARIAELQLQASTVSQKLQRFDKASQSFSPGPYLPFAATYSKAVTAHARARAANVQIRDALAQFRQVLDYLQKYDGSSRRLDDELTSFNAIYDINMFAGRSSSLYATAHDLKIAREDIAKLSAPAGLDDMRTESLAVHTHAIDGFNALAYALSPPIDDLIYSATRQIEGAATEYDAVKTKLTDRIEKLPAIRDISELPDKVEDY